MSITVPIAGTTKLEKFRTTSYVPGAAGTPGVAPILAVPAHYVFASQVAPAGYDLPLGWSYTLAEPSPAEAAGGARSALVPTPPAGFQGGGVALGVAPGRSYSTRVLVPATPAVPGIPAIAAVPSSTLIQNNLGWNASGNTVVEMTGPARYDFFAHETLVGAVVGLAQFASVDYTRLTHAFYLGHGQLQLCESGVLLPGAMTYTSNDRLSIHVAGGAVVYRKNGTTLYRSLINCPYFVRLVACLYVANDAVYDIAFANATNDAASTLRPLTGFALDVGGDFVYGPLPAITSWSSNLPNHATLASGLMPAIRVNSFVLNGNVLQGSAAAIDRPPNFVASYLPALGGASASAGYRAVSRLPAISGYSASQRYGFVNAKLPAIQVHTDSGGLMPQYDSAISLIDAVYGSAMSVLFQRARAASTLPHMVGIAASQAVYDYAASRLPAMIGRSFNLPLGYAFVGAVTTAHDKMATRQALIAGVVSRGGATFTFVGRIALPLSMRERVTVSDSFTFRNALLFSIASTVHAIEGTTSALKVAMRLVALIAAKATVADRFALQQALYVMMAERLALDGLRAGSGSGNASGDFKPVGLVAPSGQTWVINLDGSNRPSSRYEGYDFNSFAMIDGHYYGARADGIYALDGDTDDGAPVLASVDFGNLKFGTLGLKRPTNAYVGVTSSGVLVMKVVAEGEEYLYVARESSEDAATQRFDFGKGLSGNFLNFELFNGSGEDFELESIEFMVVPLSRRVHG